MKIGEFDITPKTGDTITEVRRYELITPLFGGGVNPQEPDPVSTIRAASVRGQLRFWWRATRGGQFATIAELRKAEEVLWGGAAVMDKHGNLERGGPGLVQVEIIQHAGQANSRDSERLHEIYTAKNGRKRARPIREARVHPYVSFPLQPTQAEAETLSSDQIKTVRHNVQFDLKITYTHQVATQIADLLWAWETFGGIGARTRRGFGALKLVAKGASTELLAAVPLPEASVIAADIQAKVEQIRQNIGDWALTEIPHLPTDFRNLRIIQQGTVASSIWHFLVDKLQAYRQRRDPPDAHGTHGRSRWPEPDSIRLDTATTYPHHPVRTTIRKYPRAAFGLPIITKFKDDRDGDPAQTSLQGKHHDRRASPLIIKPLACQRNGREVAVGIVFILSGQILPPDGLVLVQGQRRIDVNSARLSVDEAATITTNPGQEPIIQDAAQPDGTVDVLLGFLNSL